MEQDILLCGMAMVKMLWIIIPIGSMLVLTAYMERGTAK
jgi:hypothetical protein